MDRLLILDDEVTIAQTIAAIAELAGIEPRITTSPAEFFRQLEEWQPTHIALDLVMPEMDGVQVMADLARRGCSARIIITSGVGSRVLDAAGRSAAEHGLRIVGTLSKPFSPARLRELLLNPGARFDSGTGMMRHVGPRRRDVDPGPDELRDALAQRQLFLVYQPQIAGDTGAVTGVEALVRWRHPQLGTIMPDRFIPLAESAGLIDELTDQVLALGLEWLSQAFPGGAGGTTDAEVTLSINMSAGTLGDRDFVEDALQACRRFGVDPSRVIFELTESSAMQDPVASLDQLTRMRMKGFQLSIDDFGTGFSSMLQLARLPFSEIKVDKSFVMTAMQSMESRAVVRSILDLGASLGLRSVAEGVEDALTLEFLKGIGCDIMQGYFITRPMPGDEVTQWIAARREAAAPVRQQPQLLPARPAAVESFRWDDGYLTGLPAVDEQHLQLVELINQLGDRLRAGPAVPHADTDMLFAKLVDYAGYHFRDEESMMAEHGLDPRHVEHHRREHTVFLAEVVQMRESTTTDSRQALQSVLLFLVHWLAYHILGVDQSMSRQVAAIGAGKSPADAFTAEQRQQEAHGEPLVRALQGLFRLTSRRNLELRDANRTLENRIIERTTALSEANRQLAMIAMTDSLTGIPNRRHALAMLGRVWEASVSKGGPAACLMIDADYLKAINDEHGHEAGDEMLKAVAAKLREAIRTDDIVCRLGGDEFIVICPATPMEGALQLAEKIRHEVHELRAPAGYADWRGSVSIGVAVRDESMEDPEDLIKAADRAAYVAKDAGRNIVATAAGPIAPNPAVPA